jgi:hypothetical protein
MIKEVHVVYAEMKKAYLGAPGNIYIVGVFTRKQDAIVCCGKEENLRYGKYKCKVQTINFNESINESIYPDDEAPGEFDWHPDIHDKEVNIHLNDETGEILFSVELHSAPGNWIDSFLTLGDALAFISDNRCIYNERNFYCTLNSGNQEKYERRDGFGPA